MKEERIHIFLKSILLIFSCIVVLYGLVRICICDRFVVRGESMSPTFEDGQPVYVNKLVFGGRIYTDFDFSKSKLSSFRMPGIRNIRVGDVVMLNYPFARCNDTINFRINYVYMKRCLGCPGDSVKIQNGYYIHPKTGEDIICNEHSRRLHETSDSVLVAEGVVVDAFQINRKMNWTIRDFGPLFVPAKGSEVHLTPLNYKSYKKQIQYETGMNLKREGSLIKLDDQIIDSYVFQSDWYFFAGDNVLNSKDSRYFGLVPEEYIIGVVCGK